MNNCYEQIVRQQVENKQSSCLRRLLVLFTADNNAVASGKAVAADRPQPCHPRLTVLSVVQGAG